MPVMTPPSTRYPDAPRVAVGAVVVYNEHVLLVRRGKPPGHGLWAIPGGSVRLGETLQEAAEREILEETGIVVRAGAPVLTFDLVERDEAGQVRYHYVIVDLKAHYLSGEPRAGDDADEARWVTVQELNGLPVSATTLSLLRDIINLGQP